MMNRATTSTRRGSSIPKVLFGVFLALMPAVAVYFFLSRGTDEEHDKSVAASPEVPLTPAAPAVVLPLPLVKGFESVPATDATDWIEADELVMGVVIDGQARAYPINIMHGPEREIINDRLGGRSIAATW